MPLVGEQPYGYAVTAIGWIIEGTDKLLQYALTLISAQCLGSFDDE